MIQKEIDDMMVAIDAIPGFTKELGIAINKIGHSVNMQHLGLGPAEAREEYLEGYKILQQNIFSMEGFPKPTYGLKNE